MAENNNNNNNMVSVPMDTFLSLSAASATAAAGRQPAIPPEPQLASYGNQVPPMAAYNAEIGGFAQHSWGGKGRVMPYGKGGKGGKGWEANAGTEWENAGVQCWACGEWGHFASDPNFHPERGGKGKGNSRGGKGGWGREWREPIQPFAAQNAAQDTNEMAEFNAFKAQQQQAKADAEAHAEAQQRELDAAIAASKAEFEALEQKKEAAKRSAEKWSQQKHQLQLEAAKRDQEREHETALKEVEERMNKRMEEQRKETERVLSQARNLAEMRYGKANAVPLASRMQADMGDWADEVEEEQAIPAPNFSRSRKVVKTANGITGILTPSAQELRRKEREWAMGQEEERVAKEKANEEMVVLRAQLKSAQNMAKAATLELERAEAERQVETAKQAVGDDTLGGDATTEDSESGSPELDAVEIAVVRNRAQELQVMANTPGQKKKFRELVKAAGCKEGTWPTNDGDLEVLCKRTAAVEYLKTTPSK
jgi:hypothetical protein